MWSASSNGQIVGWDPVTLTAKKEVTINSITVYLLCISVILRNTCSQ